MKKGRLLSRPLAGPVSSTKQKMGHKECSKIRTLNIGLIRIRLCSNLPKEGWQKTTYWITNTQ